jgi:hypothetical protein
VAPAATVTLMPGREPSRPADPDDWFADPSRPSAPGRGSTIEVDSRLATRDDAGIADDWLDDEPAASRPGGPLAGRTLSVRAGLAIAATVLVLIVAGLAVAGVFSGGGKTHGTGATTTPPATTSPHTATTSPPAQHVLPAPTTVLNPGDQGAQVKVLQRALKQLDYPAGPTDGVYGPSTQAAVTRFQKASGLTPDGVVGPKTLAALKQALQNQG